MHLGCIDHHPILEISYAYVLYVFVNVVRKKFNLKKQVFILQKYV